MPLRHPQPDQPIADIVRSRLEGFSLIPDSELHALAGTAPAELSLEAPHEIYTLGLDQLQAATPDLAGAQATGWRFLLEQGGQAVAAAETGIDAEGAHRFALVNSGPFVASTAAALRQAQQFAGAAGGEVFEPRLLHVPALYAMALWLHGASGTDVVLPLRPTPATVDPERRYSLEEYLAALRQAAATVNPVGPEDTTGG
jgi:hypothetical protein